MSKASAVVDTVVFDFGGVVFNWSPPDLILAMWPHLADTREAAQGLAAMVFQSFVPGSDWSEFDRGKLQRPEVEQRLAQRTGLPQDDLVRLLDAIPKHLAPMAGTVALIERLAQAAMPLHFLSNMPRPYAQYLQREHAFLQRFDGGVFSCDVGQIKPEAVIFATAVRQFGLPAERCVFIDDHPANVLAARQCGWRAIQFVDAAQCEQELAELGVLPSPAQ
jgi:putative hydrolase of the HAD superfamily